MDKDNNFKQIEALLSGKVGNPSPRFEEALRAIPGRQASASSGSNWIGLAKLAGIAAAVSLVAWLGLDINLNDQVPTAESFLFQDVELMTLFSLSSDLEMAETLLSEDNLLALDYLTSTP